MRLVQVITDYIRRSILTTQGDLVVRGVGQPERLAAGIVGTLLKGKGAGAIPAFEDLTGAIGTVLQGQGAGVEPAFGVPKLSDHSMATGTYIRTTHGDEVITGLGFRPSLVIFATYDGVVTNRNWSIGFDSLTYRISLFGFWMGAKVGVNNARSTYILRDAANEIAGQITAFSNDGFTVSFVLGGVCTAETSWFAIE